MRQKNARILPMMGGKKGAKGARNSRVMPNGLSQEITQPYSQNMSQVRSLNIDPIEIKTYQCLLFILLRN